MSNTATGANGEGIAFQASYPALTNCIVYGNFSKSMNAVDATLSNRIAGCFIGLPTTSTNICYTNNNRTGFPGFTDYPYDFHLLSTSSCVNAGQNNAGNSLIDLDGSNRFFGRFIDIGCYEFWENRTGDMIFVK